jgi:predicted transglutaminase-like cysteine proteinase
MNIYLAAILLIFLAAIDGETHAFANASTISVVIKTTHDQAQDQIEARAHDDTKTQEKVAAPDPSQQSTKSLALAEPLIQSAASAEPFGLNAVPMAVGDLLTKWAGVEADIRAESEILERCRDGTELCPLAAQNFLDIVAEGRAHEGRARIGVINRAINLAIHPVSDLVQWGVPDRWSAPLATLTTGRGDCEDYVIAKYVALRAAGIAENDVRLVILRNLALAEDHAVVATRLDGSWIVLDNRWLALVEDVQMRRVVPLFVLDQEGVKRYIPTRMADARGRDNRQH